MILDKISYSEYEGTEKEWEIDGLTLNGINLIVGKNATGKTRTLNVINGLSQLLAGDSKIFRLGEFVAEFSEGNSKFQYILNINDSKVIKEELFIDGKILLKRGNDGEGVIFYQKEGENREFQTPEKELAIIARRDKIQHSFFEPLYNWGKSVHYYSFGTSLGREVLAMLLKDYDTDYDKRNKNFVVAAYLDGNKLFNNKFQDAIISDMNSIGYNLTEIAVKQITDATSADSKGPFMGICVKEADLNTYTQQHTISQGMFRALSVIIQVNLSLMSSTPSCIIIDDIGEGLDYDRSCKMIELLISKVENTSIQLIMSTNDRFVMNSVPLKHWTVLERNGSLCKVFNYENSQEIFDEFKFTGLSNFDFFSLDYINSEIENE